MRKKTYAIIICILAISIFFVVKMIVYHEKISKIQINDIRNKVQRIDITAYPAWFDDIDIKNKRQINRVMDYLTSINLVRTKPEPIFGESIQIKIFLNDGVVREFNQIADRYLVEKTGFSGRLSYKDAVKFHKVITSILEENYMRSGKASIAGTIISIKAEQSGRDLSCTIRDQNNMNRIINVATAKIIDTSGDGWLILHNKDDINVFYNEKKQNGTNTVFASMVFIKTHK